MEAAQPTPPMTPPIPSTIEASAEPASCLLTFSSVAIDFAAKAAADGAPARPRFDIVGYTGAVVNLGNFYTPVIVDLAGLKTTGQEIPALRDHDQGRIVGQTTSVKIGTDVRLEGIITGDNPDAVEIQTQARNGFKWQASIGATIDRREFLEAGKKATVNGREVSGPIVIARESTLREISFCALGADGATSASVAAASPTPNPNGSQPGNIPVDFETWLKAQGFDPANLSAQQKTALQAAYKAAHPDPAPTPQPNPAPAQTPPQGQNLYLSLEQVLETQRRENDRVRRITDLAAVAIGERPFHIDEFERMAKAAIDGQNSVAEFELNLLRYRASAPAVHSRSASAERTNAEVIEAAICRSGGLADVEKQFDPRTLEAAHRRYRHGVGLQELLLIVARENGFTGHSASDVRGLLQYAFLDVRAAGGGGFSTTSLPGILGNVANKFLVAGFMAVEQSWREIASTRNVKDFKAVTSYSLSGDMTYEKVSPSGELKHGTLGETSYSNQADTYGRLFAITRKDIINDDLGALTDVPKRLGRGGALKLNDVFWTAFLAGVGSFWASENSNLSSGGTSALADAGLVLAATKFDKQTDPDGKPIGSMPTILLVPPELEYTGARLMQSSNMNTGGSSSTDSVPNANVWSGKYKLVKSRYLSNSAITGYSTTAWFLLADPADIATIEVALLNGKDTPIVESADADFATLGIQMRGYHDFGVALQEYRGSVRSAGT